MRKVREVLRLRHALSLSYREIGEALGVSKTAAGEIVRRAEVIGLSWPLPQLFDDGELERRLFTAAGEAQTERPAPDKTGGAEDRDEHVGIGNRGHGRRSRAQGRPRRTRTGAAAPFWALSIAAVRRHADWSPPGPPGRGCSYIRSLTGQCINTAIRIMLSAVVRSPVSAPIILSTLLFVKDLAIRLSPTATSGSVRPCSCKSSWVLRCRKCRRDTGLTVGTVMARSQRR